MTAVITAVPLTAVEEHRLLDRERLVEEGLNSFVVVGTALAEIRDEKLYRGTHDSFELYCRDLLDRIGPHPASPSRRRTASCDTSPPARAAASADSNDADAFGLLYLLGDTSSHDVFADVYQRHIESERALLGHGQAHLSGCSCTAPTRACRWWHLRPVA